jgi:predicted transposase YdaD
MHATPPDLPRQSLDLAFRQLWKHRPESLAAVALRRPVLAVHAQPASVLVTERAPDGVATVLTPEGGCTLHLEFETSVKPSELPRRMAHAGWVLHGPREGLPVRSVAVLLEPAPALATSYEMSHGDDVIGTYRYEVVALSGIDVDTLLDSKPDQAGLLALVPLARGATERHLEEAARRLQALRAPDAADLAAIGLMLGSRKFGIDQLIRIFDKEFLMETDVWTWIESHGIEKGMARGLERGREQGLEQGRHEASRAALRAVCAARFGTALDDLVAGLSDAQVEQAIALVAAAPDAETARARVQALPHEPARDRVP